MTNALAGIMVTFENRKDKFAKGQDEHLYAMYDDVLRSAGELLLAQKVSEGNAITPSILKGLAIVVAGTVDKLVSEQTNPILATHLKAEKRLLLQILAVEDLATDTEEGNPGSNGNIE